MRCSLFAGLTDRYGRANLVVFGLVVAIVGSITVPTAVTDARHVWTRD